MYKNLKVIIVFLLLAIWLVGAYVLYNKLAPSLQMDQLATQSAGESAPEGTEAPKTSAPDFTVYDLEGESHKLSDFQGKPVVLNFWASGCGPCQMEMPDFQEMFDTYGEDIHFLLVNLTDGIRETVEKASGFIADKDYTFPVYYDVNQEAAMSYRISGVPVTYFIDAEGYLVAQGNGALNAEVIQTGIDMLLEEP